MNPVARATLDALMPVVDAAGQAILRVYANPAFRVETKQDASPVTAADLAANDIIVAGLKAAWPQIPILTEEEKNLFGPKEEPALYWAVDPLDGTKEFIKRNGEFTVNVALVEEGRAVLGIVTAPALDLAYRGLVGDGAEVRRGGTWSAIRVKPASAVLRVAASRSHPSAQTDAFLARFPSRQTREVGSSLKFCLIGEGEFDLYPRFGPTNIWDTAAGQAVLEAAGGRVTTPEGKPLRYPRPGQPLNPDFVAWGGDAARAKESEAIE